jgi:SNF2 family DNA or RNA helicase
MNVEALSRAGDARDFLERFLNSRNMRRSMVAVDESTVIKNHSAARTKYVNRTIRPLATYRRILSGLPTPRSPLDLYSQFEFLDWRILGHKSWWTFRASVAHLRQQWFGGRSVVMIDQDQGMNGFKPEAVAQLQKTIAPYSYRVEFRPKVPTTYSIRDVEMTPEQEKAYREIRDFATTELSAGVHVTATVVIAQIMRLHQVLCGHTVDELGNAHHVPENRTVALLELLEDYGGKALVWCSYDTDVRKVAGALAEEYGEESVARFWGGNLKSRDEEDRRFKTDPRCRFSVGTPAAGGRGRTLDMADLSVYYSSTDNLEHRDQSEQRTMGRDKARGVDVVDLICRGTVEEKILSALRKKINMAQVINGDTWREWIV